MDVGYIYGRMDEWMVDDWKMHGGEVSGWINGWMALLIMTQDVILCHK